MEHLLENSALASVAVVGGVGGESAGGSRPGSGLSLRIMGRNLLGDVSSDSLAVVDSFCELPAHRPLEMGMRGASTVSAPGR